MVIFFSLLQFNKGIQLKSTTNCSFEQIKVNE